MASDVNSSVGGVVRSTLWAAVDGCASATGWALRKTSEVAENHIWKPAGDALEKRGWERTATAMRLTGRGVSALGNLADAAIKGTSSALEERHIQVGYKDRVFFTVKDARQEVIPDRFELPELLGEHELPEIPLINRPANQEPEQIRELEEVRAQTNDVTRSFASISAAFCTFNIILRFFPELPEVGGENPAYQMARFAGNQTSLEELFFRYYETNHIELSFVQKLRAKVLFFFIESYVAESVETLINDFKGVVRENLANPEKFRFISEKLLANFNDFFQKCIQEVENGNIRGTRTAHFMARFVAENSDFFPSSANDGQFVSPNEAYVEFAQNLLQNSIPPYSLKQRLLDHCHIHWENLPASDTEATLRRITEIALSVIIAIPLLVLTFVDWIANEFIIPEILAQRLPEMVEQVIEHGLSNVGTTNYAYALTEVYLGEVNRGLQEPQRPRNIHEQSRVEEYVIPPEQMKPFIRRILAILRNQVFEENPEERNGVWDIKTESILTEELATLFSKFHTSMSNPVRIEQMLTRFFQLASGNFQEGRRVSPRALADLKQEAADRTTDFVCRQVSRGTYRRLFDIKEEDQRALIGRFLEEFYTPPLEQEMLRMHAKLVHIKFYQHRNSHELNVQGWLRELDTSLTNIKNIARSRAEAANNIPGLSAAFKQRLHAVKDLILRQADEALRLIGNQVENPGMLSTQQTWQQVTKLLRLSQHIHLSITTEEGQTKALPDLLREMDSETVLTLRRYLNTVRALSTELNMNKAFTVGFQQDGEVRIPGYVEQLGKALDHIQFIQHADKALDAIEVLYPERLERASFLEQIIAKHRTNLELERQEASYAQFGHRLQRSLSYAIGLQASVSDERLEGLRRTFLTALSENIQQADYAEVDHLFQLLATSQEIQQLLETSDQLRQKLRTLRVDLARARQEKVEELTPLLNSSLAGRNQILGRVVQAEEEVEAEEAIEAAEAEEEVGDGEEVEAVEEDEIAEEIEAPQNHTVLPEVVAKLQRDKNQGIEDLLRCLNTLNRSVHGIGNPQVVQLGLSTAVQAALWMSPAYPLAVPGVYGKIVEPVAKWGVSGGLSQYYSQSISRFVRKALELPEQRVVSVGSLATAIQTTNQLFIEKQLGRF